MSIEDPFFSLITQKKKKAFLIEVEVFFFRQSQFIYPEYFLPSVSELKVSLKKLVLLRIIYHFPSHDQIIHRTTSEMMPDGCYLVLGNLIPYLPLIAL